MPIHVAVITVTAAPRLTARRNAGCIVTSSGTSPLPLNASTSPCASPRASSEPASVVTVAQANAVRYEAVRLPNNVATPLKLSLAPLLYAKKRTAPAMRTKAKLTSADLLHARDCTLPRPSEPAGPGQITLTGL